MKCEILLSFEYIRNLERWSQELIRFSVNLFEPEFHEPQYFAFKIFGDFSRVQSDHIGVKGGSGFGHSQNLAFFGKEAVTIFQSKAD